MASEILKLIDKQTKPINVALYEYKDLSKSRKEFWCIGISEEGIPFTLSGSGPGDATGDEVVMGAGTMMSRGEADEVASRQRAARESGYVLAGQFSLYRGKGGVRLGPVSGAPGKSAFPADRLYRGQPGDRAQPRAAWLF